MHALERLAYSAERLDACNADFPVLVPVSDQFFDLHLGGANPSDRLVDLSLEDIALLPIVVLERSEFAHSLRVSCYYTMNRLY